MSARHVVLCTFGSAGDLHPYLAIGRALVARGCRVTLATSGVYRDAATRAGLEFHAVRPDLSAIRPGAMRRYMDERRGTERVVRELFLPQLEATCEDTRAIVAGADVVVSHPLTMAVPVLAEQMGFRWASSGLAPISFASAYDPMIPPGLPFYERLLGLPPGFHRAFLGLAGRASESWVREVTVLRKRLGLPRGKHPMWEGQHSPYLALALFSRELARPQPDWPAHAVVTGFPFADDHADMPADLAAFLAAGEPPLVFTLGTSAVHDAGAFWDVAAAAAARLQRRAVLLVGRESGWRASGALPDGVIAVEYAPHGELFPHAAAITHQGGIGTTAEALRSGRPMIVVPFAHDQFDNAARVERLGVARRLRRERWRVDEVVRALESLLADRALAARAAEVGERVRAERGAERAAEAIAGLAERG